MSKQSKKRPRRRERFFVLSLGCAKNTVDSRGMTALLEGAGYRAAGDPEQADLLVVNTCGFIGPAREESLAALRELAGSKRPGQALVAAGCWSQRDPQAILRAVPGVDAVLGTRRWMDVVTVTERLADPDRRGPLVHVPETPSPSRAWQGVPRVAIQGGSAYLKIAEGCSRACAFCAIPLIKGPTTSRPLAHVLDEAAMLAERGVKEIILIAQDTTAYGRDIGVNDGLAELLERLVKRVPQVPWIRVMYAFPGLVTPRLVEVMAHHPQVLPYVDVPLQHAHPAVLKRMRRPADGASVERAFATLRERIPEIAIRTTFIVGFPGETEEEFAVLVDFTKRMAFDRVGVFSYSHEEGTEAARLDDDVPPPVKEERRARLMEVQQPISLAKNRALVGQTMDVLIEGLGEGLGVGRSFRDAPEIDGLVLVEQLAEAASTVSPVGEMLRVQVTGALEYDLLARPLR